MIGRLAIVGAVAAEALAAYTAAELIALGYRGGHVHALTAVSFVVTAIVAFWLPRVLAGWELSDRVSRAITAACAYVVIYGAIRIEIAGDFALWDFGWARDFMRDSEATLRDGNAAVTGTIMLLALWARGAYRSSQDIELERLPRDLGMSFMVVTGILVLGSASGRSGEIARAGASFYAVAVLTLACSQLALSGTTFGQLRAGSIAGLLLAGTVAATLFCLLVFGLAFAAWGHPLGRALGWGIDTVLTIVLTPIAWVVEKLLRLILPDSIEPPKLMDAANRGISDARQGQPEEPGPVQQGATYLLRIVALLVVVGVAGAAAILFARFRRRPASGHAAGPEVTASQPMAKEGRRGPRGWFRRSPGWSKAGSPAIRLYAEVLKEADDSGRSRPAGATPDEFAPTLAETFRTNLTDEITRAFEDARYGGREPDAGQVAELERRWRLARR